jgi:hypothetical protein
MLRKTVLQAVWDNISCLLRIVRIAPIKCARTLVRMSRLPCRLVAHCKLVAHSRQGHNKKAHPYC